MAHHHEHSHNHFSWSHIKEHPICIATIIYNVLVLAVELIIIAAVTGMDFHDLLGYEGLIQGIHLLGIIILAIINWQRVHRRTHHNESTHESAGKFLSVSSVMLIAHILLLHLVPRWIGFELHEHEGAHENSEMIEYITLAGIIVFITLAFRWRDEVLAKLGLKHKYVVKLKKAKKE